MESTKMRLVGLDLDGTLLNQDKQITPVDYEAVKEAMKRGVVIVPVTGRPTCGLPKQVKELFADSYAITSNGANLIHLRTGESLFRAHLDRERVRQMIERIDTLREHQGVFVYGSETIDFERDVMMEVFCNGMGYVQRPVYERIVERYAQKPILEYIKTTRIPKNQRLVEIVDELPGDIEELSIMTNHPKLRQKIGELLVDEEDFNVIQINDNDLEVTSAKADKAKALMTLAKHLSISRSQVMACGDGGNDTIMLAAAAIGVAMGNAPEEVKRHADYVTLSNEEGGVAHVIRQFT